jgi:site-specific DNA recombinase
VTGAAIYVRISSDREGTEAGVTRQLEDCQDLAGRRDLAVARVFRENDASAYSGRVRPEWRDMLAGLAAGEFTVVVAWANDRLYRRTRDQLDLMEAVQAVGGTIVTVKDGETDPSTGEGQLRMTILASVGQFESKRKSERLKRKHEQKAAAGEWSGGGRRPTGYIIAAANSVRADNLPKEQRRKLPRPFKLVPDAREAELIRSAAQAVIGGASLHSIVQVWNDGPDPLVKDSGSRWTVSDVRRVLLSEQVAGLRGSVRATWEPILSMDQHLLLVARLNDPSRRPIEREYTATRRWLLTGFVVCGRCGSKLAGRAQNRPTKTGTTERRQYVCSSAQGGCSRLGITAPDLERYVLSAALARMDEVPAPPPDDDALPPIVTERESEALSEMRTLEARKDEMARQLADGLDARVVKVALGEINARLDGLRAEIGRTTRRPRRTFTWMRDWDAPERFVAGEITELPPAWHEQTRGLLEYLGCRATIGPARVQGVRFHPSRVEVTWRTA